MSYKVESFFRPFFAQAMKGHALQKTLEDAGSYKVKSRNGVKSKKRLSFSVSRLVSSDVFV